MWQDLPHFFRQIKERGFLTKLDTNGNHPKMLRQLLDENLLDYVAMDVKTSLSEYPKLVGGRVKAEHIEQSIAMLKAAGIPYEFRTTLIKEIHTEEVLKDMQALLAGAKRYFLQTFRPGHTLNPVFATYHSFSPDEMEQIAKRFVCEFTEVRR